MTRRLLGRKFLSLFGGEGHLATALAEQGVESLLFDVAHSKRNNIASKRVASTIDGCLLLFDIHGFDLPCSTWSRARRAPKESSFPSPMRSNLHPMGLPDLSAKDHCTALLHNKLHRSVIKWSTKSLIAGKSGYIENPIGSILWNTRGIRRLERLGARFLVVDMCQYGRQCKKATKLLVWGPAFDDVEFLRCSGHKGICSRTRKKHVVLSGVQHGQFRSSAAQVYSLEFGRSMALQLYKNAAARHKNPTRGA